MSFFYLMAFKMGEHKEECVECPPECEFRIKDKCKLYSCKKCGEFLETGSPVVRVIFLTTDRIERWIKYGRKPRNTTEFVTYHKDCYKEQLSNWIDSQLAMKEGLYSANIRI